MAIEKTLIYNQLFDWYGTLLTEKQQLYFSHYYQEDWSLSEIAEAYDVSRQAVLDNLQRTVKALAHYEDVLGLQQKQQQISEIVAYTSATYPQDLHLRQLLTDLQ